MSARELLRTVADYLDDQTITGTSAQAAALRALAARLDEEKAAILRWSAADKWTRDAVLRVLARLDADLALPLQKEPR